MHFQWLEQKNGKQRHLTPSRQDMHGELNADLRVLHYCHACSGVIIIVACTVLACDLPRMTVGG